MLVVSHVVWGVSFETLDSLGELKCEPLCSSLNCDEQTED